MKAARYLLDALQQEGIGHVFLVPGGLIDPIVTAFGERGIKLEAVVAAHEAGAAFMADGYARASRRFGVCMGIGGPGVANMVGPIASAYADQSPLLAIIGQVPSDDAGRGAFQDASAAGLDDLAYLRPITSSALEIGTPRQLPHFLQTTIRKMLGVERRPACLSLPRQVQDERVTKQDYRPLHHSAFRPPPVIDVKGMAHVSHLMKDSTNIALLAGYGVERSGAEKTLRLVAEKFAIPVATTLRAKSVFPEDHKLSLGVFGYAGSRRASELLLGDKVELLIVLGSSLHQRNTMLWTSKLQPSYKLVQVDINPAVFNHNYPVDLGVACDVGEFLRFILGKTGRDNEFIDAMSASTPARQEWIDPHLTGPRFYDEDEQAASTPGSPLHPAYVIRQLREACKRRTEIALVDSGAHRAFMAHFWECYAPHSYLTATSMAPMGWAIAAAVGAQLAQTRRKDGRFQRRCLVVTGDGCMLMHGMEIQTAAVLELPIVYVVINNSALGNVYLRLKSQGKKVSRLARLPSHNWADFARALGLEAESVREPDELAPAFGRAFRSLRPYLVEVICDPDAATPIHDWKKEKMLGNYID